MTLRVLRPCTEMWGGFELRATDPRISQLTNGLYLPRAGNNAWGIYDATGTIFPAAVDLHGPKAEIRNPVRMTVPAPADLPLAPDKYYIYGGALNPHYGHFIVNTVSRLWPRARFIDRDAKILFHGEGRPSDWLRHGFIREIFSALSIGPDNMEIFSVPTMIAQLVVPHVSLQEQHFSHRILGELGAKIGRGVLGTDSIPANHTPVYLSKTALSAGVGRVVNETIIEDRLRRRGVEIVYPETLTLRDQVRLFGERTCIAGIVGSAFHTGLFQPPRGRVIGISPTPGPNSNFYLLDGAASYQVDYYFPPDSRVADQGGHGFLTSMEFAQPDLIAEDLLELIG